MPGGSVQPQWKACLRGSAPLRNEEHARVNAVCVAGEQDEWRCPRGLVLHQGLVCGAMCNRAASMESVLAWLRAINEEHARVNAACQRERACGMRMCAASVESVCVCPPLNKGFPSTTPIRQGDQGRLAWPDPTKLQPFVRIFSRDALRTYLQSASQAVTLLFRFLIHGGFA